MLYIKIRLSKIPLQLCNTFKFERENHKKYSVTFKTANHIFLISNIIIWFTNNNIDVQNIQLSTVWLHT